MEAHYTVEIPDRGMRSHAKMLVREANWKFQ